MDPKELFRHSLSQAEHCVRLVQDDQLTNDTPCTDWNLHDLVGHMVYELMWLPEIAEGKTVKEVGDRFDGDLLGKDIQAAWDRASHNALAAVEKADSKATAHLSYGDVSMFDYIDEMARDMMIHGWDVGQSINCNLIFEPEVLKTMYDYVLPRKDRFAKSGLFGKPVDVPESATLQTKFLALVGRKAG
ncbi:MAG TPA: TIGR03086 family metal-binding protein [Candidatus Saccharimonadales bacterium]|nr:TIGR03086 family metal-binding protein [Candidatus Saccharimonadales bacterium]